MEKKILLSAFITRNSIDLLKLYAMFYDKIYLMDEDNRINELINIVGKKDRKICSKIREIVVPIAYDVNPFSNKTYFNNIQKTDYFSEELNFSIWIANHRQLMSTKQFKKVRNNQDFIKAATGEWENDKNIPTSLEIWLDEAASTKVNGFFETLYFNMLRTKITLEACRFTSSNYSSIDNDELMILDNITSDPRVNYQKYYKTDMILYFLKELLLEGNLFNTQHSPYKIDISWKNIIKVINKSKLQLDEIIEQLEGEIIKLFEFPYYIKKSEINKALIHSFKNLLSSIDVDYKSAITSGIISNIPLIYSIPNPYSIYKSYADIKKKKGLFEKYGWIIFLSYFTDLTRKLIDSSKISLDLPNVKKILFLDEIIYSKDIVWVYNKNSNIVHKPSCKLISKIRFGDARFYYNYNQATFDRKLFCKIC